jgi:REP element-mobilizing transposase RayT
MNYVSFFTATVLNWKKLLAKDKYKDIITGSMHFLVADGRVRIFAFVIMPNHIHIVWRVKNKRNPSDIQRDFLKYTAQQIKLTLQNDNQKYLEEFYVGANDRKYQIWERNPLISRLTSIELVEQKINYIHANPIRGNWNLANEITEYKYSSARFYYEGIDDWGFLTHYIKAEDE